MRPANFPKTKIKECHIKNPFVVLAHPTPLTNPNGRVTPELLMFYKALAKTEAALVIAGPATIIPPASRRFSLLRVDQPKYLDGLRTLCKIIESNGALAGIQIVHPGRVDASDLLTGLTRFPAAQDSLDEDKLPQLYKNAVSRSIEVGFRYVELCADDFLILHQLMEQQREDLVKRIFSEALSCVTDQCVLALRPPPDDPNHRWSKLFLEMGGDMVCLQESESGTVPNVSGQDHVLVQMRRPRRALGVQELLKQAHLIGLAVGFKDKQRQIMEYLSLV